MSIEGQWSFSESVARVAAFAGEWQQQVEASRMRSENSFGIRMMCH